MAKKDKAARMSLSNGRPKSKIIPSVSSLNEGQKEALRAIANPENSIVFINGIAGTGKTFISASWGLEQLLKGKFDKMVITRPYVEAGESLGFLPGDFDSKIAPFMIPIFDVMSEHLSKEDIDDLIKSGRIVTLPLAYMRGVTFKNSFVLLDEGQNATVKQMHLFLTRIGQNSKIVVTGDWSQSDLGPKNGFADALDNLKGVEGENGEKLQIITLDPNSVVRHGIISAINKRYEQKLGRKDAPPSSI
jgi:phosphate starvation-inducible PhoH-like protein